MITEKNYAFGLEFNTNLTFFDWWDAGIQGAFSYVEDRFQGVDGKLYSNGRPTYNFNVNNRFALNNKAYRSNIQSLRHQPMQMPAQFLSPMYRTVRQLRPTRMWR